MKFLAAVPVLAAVVQAAYPGDIVQYWVNQQNIIVNSSVIGGLYSPPSGWATAIVNGAIYSAAVSSSSKPHAFQQLAVSHAAHDALAWIFHGARVSNNIDNALRGAIAAIGISQSSRDYQQAAQIGQAAAVKVVTKRSDDNYNKFVDYVFGPANPGVYQPTPGGRPLPDVPQARFLRPFGGIKDITKFRAPAPPKATGKGYEKWVTEVRDLGGLNSTLRTEDETEIAYFWLESSVAGWNRFAHAVVGDKLANNVVASAKFYAQLNYALANAAIGSWDSKFTWNHWRPITAIHRPGAWLESGRDVSDPSWTPLLRPTPSHQDYVSTHSAFGAAGAAVIKAFNGGDKINTGFSSNVTLDGQGVITRHFTSIEYAAYENARSRVFGGVHFTYAGDAGLDQGYAIASKIPLLDVVCDLYHPETNPAGYVSLGVAENTLMHDEIIEHMTKNTGHFNTDVWQFSIDSHSLTYGDGFSGSHRLRETIARFINRNFNPVEPVSKDQLLITSGVGQAIELSGFSLCDKGDGVLLAQPHYGNFPIDLGYRVEAKIIGVSFEDTDPFGLETLVAYEKALENAQRAGIRVKALLLCNPHNPLGRCYTREVLEAYMRFCQKHSLHLISDEVYALSVWENPDAPNAPGFTSVLAIDNEGILNRNLVHALWGMSKDFGSNGIRLGCLISRNADFIRACEANSYFSCPSSLSDLATWRILSDDAFVDSFIQTNRRRLAENYCLTARFLDDHRIPYKRGANAGLFIWVNLFDPIQDHVKAILEKQATAGVPSERTLRTLEAELQETLLKHRIFLALGADFGGDVPGWFRIIFAHEEKYLTLGLSRMVEGVEAFRASLEQR
ncbi:putative aminotransferase tcpI [Paramyrothecium foliicola]|nr:putative aminotransferase tcpI [Paramyrothecium foliicola]